MLLRVVLTVLLVVVGLEAGIKFAPRLARWTGDGRRETVFGPRSPVSPVRAAQPDWGGGRISWAGHSPGAIIDSAKTAARGEPSRVQTYTGSTGGVLLQQKSGNDYALTMAMAAPGQAGRSALLEVPSSEHFRKELLPREGEAEPPARDIPLYPRATVRMQVGQGTACFVGFYLTPDSTEAVRAFYVRALGRLGWQRVSPERRETEDGGRSSVSGLRSCPLETFDKPAEDRTVVVQLTRQDSLTTRIGLVAMASGGLSTEDGGREPVFGPRSPVSACNERK